jgi:hypothetical protein
MRRTSSGNEPRRINQRDLTFFPGGEELGKVPLNSGDSSPPGSSFRSTIGERARKRGVIALRRIRRQQGLEKDEAELRQLRLEKARQRGKRDKG